MAMDALASRQMSLWLINGGDWFIALADNQQKQAKTALEKCQHCPLFLNYTVAPANMLLLMPIIQMMSMNGKKDVDLHQVLWSRSRLGERQKGGELQVLIISGLVIHLCAIAWILATCIILIPVLSLGRTDSCAIAIIKNHRTLCRSPETIYKILNRKTTAMADPLIAHRIKTLLFRVVDIHNNVFTTAIQVAKQKYQREHFIPEGVVPYR